MHKEEVKKNILICGYPKSGSTWATRLTAQLLDSPAAGYWGFDGPTLVTEGENRNSSLACFKSHAHYHELIQDKRDFWKIIYIIRDPRDMVVSGIHHFSFPDILTTRVLPGLPLPLRIKGFLKNLNARAKSKGYKIKRMIGMLSQGDPYIPHCQWSLDEHLRSFLKKPEVLIITYEALLENSLMEAQKILEHCGLNKTTEEIDKDLAAQSFTKKKMSFSTDKDKSQHLRKGISGDWVNHLSKEQTKAIQSVCRHEFFKTHYFN